MANGSGLSRRAALRQQQELEERRKRNARLIGVGLGAVAVLVLVVLAVVIFQTLGKGKAETANQQTPPNATAGSGIQVTSHGTEPAADAPHVVVYEDFQCPACASRSEAYAPAMYDLVDQGKITVEYRMATFMEKQIGNDSSTNAAMAAAAADAVGKYREYHQVVFANQSPQGAGYSDQQLRIDFPAQVGIDGDALTKFQELYDGRAFADFVKASNKEFESNNIGSTPTYLVGDTPLAFYDQESDTVLIQPTSDDLYRAIMEVHG